MESQRLSETVFTDLGGREIKEGFFSNETVQIIAGLGEEGNNDCTRALFSQLMVICMEKWKNIFTH